MSKLFRHDILISIRIPLHAPHLVQHSQVPYNFVSVADKVTKWTFRRSLACVVFHFDVSV